MPVTVKVNGVANSLVHKGSNAISTATIPDVCKTPSPGGPVPIPYPNISQSITLDKGTTTVKADGGMMIAIKGSEFSLSNGDNAGVAGGVTSSTFMKESTWILYSFDVKMDGQNACRLTDKKFHNHENTVNLGGALQAPVVVGSLLMSIVELNNGGNLEPLEVERVFGWSFVADVDRSNEFFEFLVGREPAKGGADVEAIELRVPRSPAKTGNGFLLVTLSESSTLTGSDVVERLGQPDSVLVPTQGASARYAVDYVYRKSSCEMHFAIGPTEEDKVRSISVDRTTGP